MTIIEQIQQALAPFNGTWEEKGGKWHFKSVLKEKKGFLSRSTIHYLLTLRVDDDARRINLSDEYSTANSGISFGDPLEGEVSVSGSARYTKQKVLFSKSFSSEGKPQKSEAETLFDERHAQVLAAIQRATEYSGYTIG